MKKSFLVLIAMFLFTASGFSQNYPGTGKFGLGIDGITSSPNIVGKYYFTDKIAGMIIAGADFDIPGGEETVGTEKVTGTDIRAGLAFMYHFTNTKVSPYLGIQGIYQNKKESGFYTTGTAPDARSYLNAGVIFGIDYFFDKNISVGIKETVGTEISFERDVPKQETNTKMNTNTVLTARFYF
ncbi:MAG TPA: hypothetical protein VN514_08790 [Ignavibacteria bacterium]|nr:hypothetical protein [Ignavibacteria bacterium]